jgi:hypothetical protein
MISLKKTNNTKSIFNNNIIKEDIDDDIRNLLDNYDLILLSKLNNLRDALTQENVNIKTVKQQIKDISMFDQSQNYSYLNNLLYPEKNRGCKIPSQVPVPSCAFQLHNCVSLKTNSSGNIGVMLNPFFLGSEDLIGYKTYAGNDPYYLNKFMTTLWVNNHNNLTGYAEDDNWTPVNIGQVIPPVYDQYRLVSAAMTVKYIGQLDGVKGVIGGAIIYDDMDSVGGNLQNGTGDFDPQAAGFNTKCPQLSKYGNFDLAMDSYYHQSANCLEGIRMLYFPIDNNYEEYIKTVDGPSIEAIDNGNNNIQLSLPNGCYKGAFNWFFYGLGCPTSVNCFKIDIYCNFECIPKAKFLNYLPISINPYIISSEEKKRLMLAVQNKPVLKGDEEGGEGVLIPSLFTKMIKKFRNGLPSLDRMKAWGLIRSLPGLKSGLALAGAMIQSNMMDYDD